MSDTVTAPLTFTSPSKEIYNKIQKYYSPYSLNNASCEYTPETLLLWHKLYNEQVAFAENTVFIKTGIGEKTAFLLPLTDNMKFSVELIKDYCAKEGITPTFLGCEGEPLNTFLNLYSNEFITTPVRNNFEYIYTVEALKNLSGKKYHQKRNHLSSFSRSYNWSYESLSQNNLSEVLNMADEWKNEMLLNNDNPQNLLAENEAIKRVLPNMSLLNIKGGVIRVDGKLAAFCFGSPINESVFDVHIEKALLKYRTAYTVINNEFVKNELSGYKYVNREDDMGLDGLRKAKLSYNPEFLLKKYIIKAK